MSNKKKKVVQRKMTIEEVNLRLTNQILVTSLKVYEQMKQPIKEKK
ncbi:MAG: hypothetical protein I3274_02705 [Candidatus Moeniiplasma glomeromycotorum]|nr:hypothetical protein [Candidatus Moeniiplasma glomeromycotorum]MCE8167515.1 hypothetical protein [Candidatus Moeniiplasma glomeromycotorum]